MNKTLQDRFEEVCELYVRAFLTKHGFHENGILNDGYWVGDDVGGIYEINDYYISLSDMRADIDEEAPEDMFFEWYDYSLNKGMDKVPCANYKNYLKGAR